MCSIAQACLIRFSGIKQGIDGDGKKIRNTIFYNKDYKHLKIPNFIVKKKEGSKNLYDNFDIKKKNEIENKTEEEQGKSES